MSDARSSRVLDPVRHDLRYALRTLTKNWGFTILAVASLGHAMKTWDLHNDAGKPELWHRAVENAGDFRGSGRRDERFHENDTPLAALIASIV